MMRSRKAIRLHTTCAPSVFQTLLSFLKVLSNQTENIERIVQRKPDLLSVTPAFSIWHPPCISSLGERRVTICKTQKC
jgi:hypothetical protein